MPEHLPTCYQLGITFQEIPNKFNLITIFSISSHFGILDFISSERSLFGGFRYIYNRKKILFIVPVDDNRRIQINAFPCADNRKQVEGRVIFFSSFHKTWFVWMIDFVFHCPQ